MKTYLHYLWFRFKTLLKAVTTYWKEDYASFLCWIWIFTSCGGVFSSIFFMAINQNLGKILLVVFFTELSVPILYWSRGWFIIETALWLIHIPRNIFYWFQERVENYQKWKNN